MLIWLQGLHCCQKDL